MNSKSDTSLFEMTHPSRGVQLSIDKLSKGIDNYHIDVKLSTKFSSDIKKLVALLVSQVAIPKPKNWDNSTAFDKIRAEYLDMMTILIHRVKTDLSADEICFLQFAAIKIILRITKAKLDSDIENVTSRLADLRHKDSSEALAIDQRLFWLKKITILFCIALTNRSSLSFKKLKKDNWLLSEISFLVKNMNL